MKENAISHGAPFRDDGAVCRDSYFEPAAPWTPLLCPPITTCSPDVVPIAAQGQSPSSPLPPPPPPPGLFDFDEFDFHAAPLSSVYAPLTAGAVYVVVVLCLNYYMGKVRGGKGVETKMLQAVHNMILCVGSLIMFVGTLRELVLRVQQEAVAPPAEAGALGGMYFFFCEAAKTEPRGALFFWSYIYYLSKYYELLDTVLQLLKGRPPPHFFLHVYHHAVVLVMAWAWLEYVQTLQFGGLLFNTAVHVVMYYYYFRRVLNLPVPWKRLVTQFQIIQFGTSAACYFVTLYLLATGAECRGSHALVGNFVFNMTLLYQFFGVLGGGEGEKKKKAK